MAEIRAVEERIQTLYSDGHVRGSTHLCAGQEAVAVGVAVAARPTDVVTCTYRGHGQALALGLTPQAVIGEVLGRVIGCTGGLGGSMHLCNSDVGLLPTFAIVGAGLPVATGAALTFQVKDTNDAAIAVFGDGAANIGAFHEALNLASIWALPVIFVCENNLYGEYTRIDLTTPVADLARRAESYAMPGVIVDGQDVDAVSAVVSEALARARDGEGPTLIEAKTYRYSGHSRSDPAAYRPPGELDTWRARDPIDILGERLVSEGVVTVSALYQVRTAARDRVEQAVTVALSSPEPSTDEMFRHVFATA
jgi:pyruvate dehydrogenase E1 component alpha subunit